MHKFLRECGDRVEAQTKRCRARVELIVENSESNKQECCCAKTNGICVKKSGTRGTKAFDSQIQFVSINQSIHRHIVSTSERASSQSSSQIDWLAVYT